MCPNTCWRWFAQPLALHGGIGQSSLLGRFGGRGLALGGMLVLTGEQLLASVAVASRPLACVLLPRPRRIPTVACVPLYTLGHLLWVTSTTDPQSSGAGGECGGLAPRRLSGIRQARQEAEDAPDETSKAAHERESRTHARAARAHEDAARAQERAVRLNEEHIAHLEQKRAEQSDS